MRLQGGGKDRGTSGRLPAGGVVMSAQRGSSAPPRGCFMDTDHTVLPAQTQLGVPGSVGPGLHHGGCVPRPQGSQPTLLRS